VSLQTPCIIGSLAEIRRRVRIPLALHGVSGTDPQDLRRCAEMGVQKFNVYSDMVTEAARRLRPSLERGEDIVAWQQAIWGGFRDVAAGYMELFGSAGRGANGG
jgi:fructose-bisphosphate aldolase class II